MTVAITAEQAFARRKPLLVPGYTDTTSDESYFVTRYFGALTDNVDPENPAPEEEKSHPQAYYVEQPPHATVPPHYHDTNQFQIFLKGRAIFGRKPVASLTVHYASGHTPYGPIITESDSTHYLTLRNLWDSGGKTMPDCRVTLRKICRRFHLIENIKIPDPTTVASGESETNEVLPCEDDGLGVAVITLGEGASSDLALSRAGAGRYAHIVAGAVELEGQSLGLNSCLYLGSDSNEPVRACAGGAAIVVMQFPPEPF
jgi:hypothetical protein